MALAAQKRLARYARKFRDRRALATNDR